MDLIEARKLGCFNSEFGHRWAKNTIIFRSWLCSPHQLFQKKYLANWCGGAIMPFMKVLITGGAGFIGSNFVRYALGQHADWEIWNYDKLTYAGNLASLKDVENNPRYHFVKGDI